MTQLYDSAVIVVLAIHLLWILWVIFGALWTQGRPWWTVFHLASLIWGILVEVGPWPCPLTLAEQYFQLRAGVKPFRGSFLLHYLNLLVYPNISVLLLTICGVAVCVANLAIYARRWRLAGMRGRDGNRMH